MRFFDYSYEDALVNWTLAPEEIKHDYLKRVKKRELGKIIRTCVFIPSIFTGVGGIIWLVLQFIGRSEYEGLLSMVTLLGASALIGYLLTFLPDLDKRSTKRWKLYVEELVERYPYPDSTKRKVRYYEEQLLILKRTKRLLDNIKVKQ